MRFSSAFRLAAWLLALGFGFGVAGAQTLARPGWKGSGMAPEGWWRSAVLYRIAPEHFQDSDGDGLGDLRGIAERLDYLQALGVDAVVLQLPFEEKGFDELLAEATHRHIRLVIGLDRDRPAPPDRSADIRTLVPEARHWLARGAAGILLPALPPGRPAIDSVQEEDLRLVLRQTIDDYPGQRVLISAPFPNSKGTPQEFYGSGGIRQLVSAVLPLPVPERSSLRPALTTALATGISPDAVPLLALQNGVDQGTSQGTDPAQDAACAAVLLTQRSAVLLEYGQELGAAAPDRMPWTPTNVTPPPPRAEAAEAPAKASGEIVYGPYRPYVPPAPKPKAVATSANEIVLPDPDTLPGFSSKALASGHPRAGVASVFLQERDRRSTWNLYRELIALHHGNATLRNGSLSLLKPEGDAVAWLRRAPAGARTVSSVVVAANVSDRPVTISLAADFERLGVRAGTLRSLLPGSAGMEGASSDHLVLPAHGIFVGELVHGR